MAGVCGQCSTDLKIRVSWFLSSPVADTACVRCGNVQERGSIMIKQV